MVADVARVRLQDNVAIWRQEPETYTATNIDRATYVMLPLAELDILLLSECD